MKIGDKAKGFRFESYLVNYSYDMDPYVGVEGEIFKIMEDRFTIIFKEDSLERILRDGSQYHFWTYPLAEYIQIQREERLKELGL